MHIPTTSPLLAIALMSPLTKVPSVHGAASVVVEPAGTDPSVAGVVAGAPPLAEVFGSGAAEPLSAPASAPGSPELGLVSVSPGGRAPESPLVGAPAAPGSPEVGAAPGSPGVGAAPG
ncbi:hypothetical protein SERLA73DRAFT_72465 [Serpula lacrymans var. lacrymans S7.3]|uniref:Uncharacterized protein n=1 Tax=Serpula lacrymans var. lacrymans (strain S7.3) TaxID=936435 RepID=F8PUE5_SERL3|nr:hypothetical protein SERLA73DRAFT_72465 [Serpula lacrymans var. lacrymans S7.3]